MNDLTTMNASPRTLRVGADEYRLHPLALADLTKLQGWVDGQFPDPYEAAARALASGRFTVEQQRYILKTAAEQAARSRRLVGTPEADELLQSAEGVVQLLLVSISKGDPAFDAAAAERLNARLTFADVARVMSDTNLDMVLSDPKAAAGATTTPTSPGPTTPSPA